MSASTPHAETPRPLTSGVNKRWEPPSPEELQALMLGYTIEKLLGKGGMGAVYKGIQTNLDRPVAIKIISNDLDEADVSYGERFKNEAKAMAKLNFPGIVSVFDYGQTTNGILYIVMEFVEGTDVAKMISQQKRLHTDHAMAVTAHVCDALAYAHERGIIHRDIKPANIMVGYDGVVKVADFGLAKMMKSGESGLTQSGMAMGTLHYMAPEALMLGSSVDHRADIYAVGVMLYQMLTGKLPQGMFELPSLQVPGLDPRYDGIIAKALRDDRELRYQSVRELRGDLDSILTQPVVQVDPQAAQAPAALPTTARPQRPTGQPYRPPQSQVIVRTEKKGSPLLWAALIVMCGVAGWLFFKDSNSRGVPLPDKPPATVATTTNVGVPNTPPLNDGLASVTKTPPSVNNLSTKSISDATPAPKESVSRSSTATPSLQIEPGYTALLEASLLDGWKEYGTGGGMELKDSVVTLKPAKNFAGTWWYARQAFGDFNLRLQFRLASPDANSGVMLRMARPDEGPDKHYDVDISNDANPLERTGAIMFVKAPMSNPQKDGEWNDLEIDANYQNYRVLVNGILVNDFFGSRSTVGHIGFQLGRGVVQLRNVRIKELLSSPPAQSASPPPLPTGPTIWTDTQGRTITAAFKAIASGNVLLDIAGKVTPVPLNTLSAASQKLARDYQQQTLNKIIAGDPAKATKDTPFINTLDMKFVTVPDTNVLFCIHETRYRDYAAYAADVRNVHPRWKDYQTVQGYALTDRADEHPVKNVTYDDAMGFCQWLSKKEGRTYRIPTDQEWSYAVGIGHKEKWTQDTTPEIRNEKLQDQFPWGTRWPPPKAAGNFADTTWNKTFTKEKGLIESYTDGFPTTAPVMSFKPNNLGIYDLSGNVNEWVEDWWNTEQKERAMRGAAYFTSTRGQILSSWRGHLLPSTFYGNAYCGFRCVLETANSATTAAKTATVAATQAPLTPAKPAEVAEPLLLPSGPTIWTDTKGNTLLATFKAIAGGNVLLEIAGKVQPFALNSLSETSQKLARDYQQQIKPSTLNSRTDHSVAKVDAPQASSTQPKNLEEALLNFTWEWTHAPKPPDELTFHKDGTATCPRFSWRWKITGPRTVIAFDAMSNGKQVAGYTATLQFDADFKTLEAATDDGNLHYTGRRMNANGVTVANPAPQPSKIPADALSFGKSRYAYYPGTFTWKEAKAKAEALGGHLATVTTAAEDAWVIANFESKVSPGRKQFWIGASQKKPNQSWQWVTEEPFSYTQWAPSEPNNAKGTDLKSIPPYMLGYLIQGGRMGWNDFSESQANWRDIIVGYLVEWDNVTSAS